jgi:hypothetical protein
LIGCKKKKDQDLVQATSSDVSTAQAFRILEQATFGPTEYDMNEVQSLGLTQWIEKQLLRTTEKYFYHLPFGSHNCVFANRS